MRGIFSWEDLVERGLGNGKMGMCMRGVGKMIKNMGWGILGIRMGGIMKENFNLGGFMEKGYRNGLMGIYMKEVGKMERNMGKECIDMPMEMCIKVRGKQI
jgi:hypothetical protein